MRSPTDPNGRATPWVLTRAAVAAAATATAAAALGRAALAAGTEVRLGAGLDDAVALAVLVVAAAAATALALGLLSLTAGVAARAVGRSLRAADVVAGRLTPAVVRRVVTAGLGVTLGLGSAVSAQAAETDLLWVVTDGPVVSESTAAEATPGRAGTSAPRGVPAVAAPADEEQATSPEPLRVDVRPGDSLWSIAATHLGPGAGDREVAHEWPRWYDANRDVVGDDPDHIEPGQVLVAPEGADR